MGNKRCEGDVIRQGQEQYVLHRYGGMTEGAPRIKHLEPQKKAEGWIMGGMGMFPEPQQDDMGKLNDMLDKHYKEDKIKPLKFIENGMTDYVYYEKINEIVKYLNERD